MSLVLCGSTPSAPSFARADRLIIYYTGHGGPKGEHPTTGRGRHGHLERKRHAGQRVHRPLDKLPVKVRVVMVMVQCFSGGFADSIYNDCDAAKDLSSRNRCGFFATIPDRVAAGCTPDMDEEDYKEYSTYFWAALSGHTRTGKAVASADYDGDGKISFAEAHAFTLVNSDTVDISIKSSDGARSGNLIAQVSTARQPADPAAHDRAG